MKEYKNEVQVEMPFDGYIKNFNFKFEIKLGESKDDKLKIFFTVDSILENHEIVKTYRLAEEIMYFMLLDDCEKINDIIKSFIEGGFISQWKEVTPQKKKIKYFCETFQRHNKKLLELIILNNSEDTALEIDSFSENIQSKEIYEKLNKIEINENLILDLGWENYRLKKYANTLKDIEIHIDYINLKNYTYDNYIYDKRKQGDKGYYNGLDVVIFINDDKLNIFEEIVIEYKEIKNHIIDFINGDINRRYKNLSEYLIGIFKNDILEKYVSSLKKLLKNNYIVKDNELITPLSHFSDKTIKVLFKNNQIFEFILKLEYSLNNISDFKINIYQKEIFGEYRDGNFWYITTSYPRKDGKLYNKFEHEKKNNKNIEKLISTKYINKDEFLSISEINKDIDFKSFCISKNGIFKSFKIIEELIEFKNDFEIISIDGLTYGDFSKVYMPDNVQNIKIEDKLDYINKYCKLFVIDNSKQKATIQFKFKNGDNVGNGKQEFFGDNLIDEVYKFILNNDICIVE